MTRPLPKGCTILVGDVRDRLRELPSNHFDCVVTSPPYWGLRNYGLEPQVWGGDPACSHCWAETRHPKANGLPGLSENVGKNARSRGLPRTAGLFCADCGAWCGDLGLEPTLAMHVENLVGIFREVRRVLKPHGTVWLNYGDCYAAQPNGRPAAEVVGDDRTFRDKPFSTVGPVLDRSYPKTLRVGKGGNEGNASSDHGARIVPGGFLKPKDLCMIPNRLAIALQDDGWWVRSEIIWHKRNPMPESVYDRPTQAHEKVWLLTKSEDYFYNDLGIREPVTGGAHARASGPNSRQKIDRVPLSRKVKVPGGWDVGPGAHGTINRSGRTSATYRDRPGVTPKSAGERTNIKAKASFHATTTQLVETRNARNVWSIASAAFKEAHFATFPPALAERCVKAGTPAYTCGLCGAVELCGGLCERVDRAPGRVLDPFGGAGTVGLVAERLGWPAATLIELNPEYAAMARRRIYGEVADISDAPQVQAAE